MALVVQSFGKESEYRRAVLAVLSYYAQRPVKPLRTILFSDNPQYFQRYFSELPVEYELLTPERIAAMRGRIDFLHRMKIAMIEDALLKYREDVLYIDSDTFFFRDPSALMSKISETHSSMHVREYDFNEMQHFPLPAGKPFVDFYNLIQNSQMQIEAEIGVSVSTAQSSWNAGAMMLHESIQGLLKYVYQLTDKFYPATRNHASEQYAFSIVLQEKTSIFPCDEAIFHYWYRVKKNIIDLFLEKKIEAVFENNSLDEKLSLTRQWCSMLPLLLHTHIYTLRDNAVQAFNEDKFASGYRWAVKALLKDPLNWIFIKDVLYHIRRHIQSKK